MSLQTDIDAYGSPSNGTPHLQDYVEKVVNRFIEEFTSVSASQLMIPAPQTRLSFAQNTPVTTTDLQTTNAQTLWLNPYTGNRVPYYNGSIWGSYALSSALSFSLSGLLANTNYDIFTSVSGNNMTMNALAWTNSTTRLTGLSYLNGRLVRSDNLLQMYHGTIRTVGAGQGADTVIRRYLYNHYNRVPRLLYLLDGSTHGYNGAIRSFNNNGADVLEFVMGVVETPIKLSLWGRMTSVASVEAYMLISENAIGSFLADGYIHVTGANSVGAGLSVERYPRLGQSTYYLAELTGGIASNATFTIGGMQGEILA
jgi:hypothetical protein